MLGLVTHRKIIDLNQGANKNIVNINSKDLAYCIVDVRYLHEQAELSYINYLHKTREDSKTNTYTHKFFCEDGTRRIWQDEYLVSVLQTYYNMNQEHQQHVNYCDAFGNQTCGVVVSVVVTG